MIGADLSSLHRSCANGEVTTSSYDSLASSAHFCSQKEIQLQDKVLLCDSTTKIEKGNHSDRVGATSLQVQ